MFAFPRVCFSVIWFAHNSSRSAVVQPDTGAEGGKEDDAVCFSAVAAEK